MADVERRTRNEGRPTSYFWRGIDLNVDESEHIAKVI